MSKRERYNTGHPDGPNRGVPRSIQIQCFRRDNFECKMCGGIEGLTAAHITSRAELGPTAIDNLETLCAVCHIICDTGVWPHNPKRILRLHANSKRTIIRGWQHRKLLTT